MYSTLISRYHLLNTSSLEAPINARSNMGAALSCPDKSKRSLQNRLDKALHSRAGRRPADERFSVRFKERFGDFDLLSSTRNQGVALPVYIVAESRKPEHGNQPIRILDRVCYSKANFVTVQEHLRTQTGHAPKRLVKPFAKGALGRRTAVYYEHQNLGSVASQLQKCGASGGRTVSVPTRLAVRMVRQVLEAIHTLHPQDDGLDAFEHGNIGLESILGHVDERGEVNYSLSGFDNVRHVYSGCSPSACMTAMAADVSKVVIVVQELIALSYRDPNKLPDLAVLKAIELELTELLRPDSGENDIMAREMRSLTSTLSLLEEKLCRQPGRLRPCHDGEDMAAFSERCQGFVWDQTMSGGDLYWKTRDELHDWARANLNPLDEWMVVWWSKESSDPVFGVELPARFS